MPKSKRYQSMFPPVSFSCVHLISLTSTWQYRLLMYQHDTLTSYPAAFDVRLPTFRNSQMVVTSHAAPLLPLCHIQEWEHMHRAARCGASAWVLHLHAKGLKASQMSARTFRSCGQIYPARSTPAAVARVNGHDTAAAMLDVLAMSEVLDKVTTSIGQQLGAVKVLRQLRAA